MINIIVVDDCPSDAQLLISLIHKYAEESGREIAVRHYESALRFLSEYRSDADIIFMDIELPDINGIMASGKLRRTDGDVALVFVTNLAHMAISGYAVEASDFIVKPVHYCRLSALMNKLSKRLEMKGKDYISVVTNHGVERFRLSQVLYIEAEAHRITYHLAERSITYSGTLSACEKALPQDSFFRCFQSFIVNLRYVLSCTGSEIIMVGGDKIPLSRAKRKQFMEALTRYMHG